MRTLLLLLAVIISSGSAQSSLRTGLVNGKGDAVTVKIGVPTEFGSRFIVVTGAPYSAEQILEHEQTLADGGTTTVLDTVTTEHAALIC